MSNICPKELVKLGRFSESMAGSTMSPEREEHHRQGRRYRQILFDKKTGMIRFWRIGPGRRIR